MKEAIDKIDFLARSPYRVPLLATLNDQELGWRDLNKRCGASRTALKRNLDALEDQDWIQNTNQKYTLTKQGEAVTEQLLQLIEIIRTGDRVQPVLQWLPDDDFDLDLRLLADAKVITRVDGDPYILQNHYIKRLQEAKHVQALLPTTGLRSWKVAHEKTLAGELECELVVSPAVAEIIQTSPDYKVLLKDVLKTDHHDIFVVDDQIPYLIVLMDDYVQIGGYDEDNLPRGLIETDQDEVYKWAEQMYEAYKQQARPINKEDLADRSEERRQRGIR